MKAAVFHGERDIRLEDIEQPLIGDDELLLSVAAVGICGTDAAEFTNGPSMFPIHTAHPVTGHCGPMVPGHEFSGVVAGIGRNVTGFRDGDLVTSGAGISCGRCGQCEAGRTNLCDTYSTVGLQRNGALAEFVAVPAKACINISTRSVSADVAALAQPMSIAVHAMRRGDLRAGDEVVVLGAGGIGAFLIHAAAKQGAAVVAVDLDPERLEIAEALGATGTIQASRDIPLLELLADQTDRPQVVYECTGIAPAIDASITAVRPGGRVVVVGLQKGAVEVNLLSVALQEKELVGTLAHVFGHDFGHAVDLLGDETDLWGRVAPTVLPLDNLVEGGILPMVEGNGAPIKALLDPRLDKARPTRTR